MKLVLKKIHDDDNEFDISDVTVEADKLITLTDALELYERFLSACGFIIPPGGLIVEYKDEQQD